MNQRNAEIIRLWNEGLSTRVVAERVGVSAPLVSALILRRRGSGEITRPKASGSRNEKRNAKIVKLWNSGLSAREVAAVVGCTKNVVLAAVARHRALGDITRPMVHSHSERSKLWNRPKNGFRCKGREQKHV